MQTRIIGSRAAHTRPWRWKLVPVSPHKRLTHLPRTDNTHDALHSKAWNNEVGFLRITHHNKYSTRHPTRASRHTSPHCRLSQPSPKAAVCATVAVSSSKNNDEFLSSTPHVSSSLFQCSVRPHSSAQIAIIDPFLTAGAQGG
jgi:hypothetical protein